MCRKDLCTLRATTSGLCTVADVVAQAEVILFRALPSSFVPQAIDGSQRGRLHGGKYRCDGADDEG